MIHTTKPQLSKQSGKVAAPKLVKRIELEATNPLAMEIEEATPAPLLKTKTKRAPKANATKKIKLTNKQKKAAQKEIKKAVQLTAKLEKKVALQAEKKAAKKAKRTAARNARKY